MDLYKPDLRFKHAQMALGPFPFLRAAYYRWTELFPQACPELAAAPEVLAVGDLHVENFGTWRDAEGRLIWGINDFDEAHRLPGTNDLVRLAASARLAIAEDRVQVSFKEAARAILAGYRAGLDAGGGPVVLEERNKTLRRQALGRLRDPVRFWAQLDALPAARGKPSPVAAEVLRRVLPPGTELPLLRRRRAGLGSLGHPRLVAIVNFDGGSIAREAKAAVGPASAWMADPEELLPANHYTEIVNSAIRAPDPFLSVQQGWVIRRLAPDCSRVELGSVPSRANQSEWLRAMGWETANVHLGSRPAISAVARDIAGRPASWLRDGARTMVDAIKRDQAEWAAAHRRA
ncbi:MAG: DUF2252 domain-containing protein [Candidatus Dormibacteraceae bacterium]